MRRLKNDIIGLLLELLYVCMFIVVFYLLTLVF
jgi:hypothetical protein